MNNDEYTKEELKELSRKKVKRTGNYTRQAIKAQRELWEEFAWAERSFNVKDDGVSDRDFDDIYYEGYDHE